MIPRSPHLAASARSGACERASTSRWHTPGRLLALGAALAVSTGLALAACSAEAEGPIANRVTMTVTDKGFEPQNLRVRANEPVTLIITRTSDVTCATEITLEEYNINTKLPLNEAVTVSFVPTKTGELRYGCAMKKMVGGVIKVL